MKNSISRQQISLAINQLRKAVESQDWSLVKQVISALELNSHIGTDKNLSEMIKDVAQKNIDKREL